VTATVAPPNGNGFAVLLCMFLIVSAITCVVLWIHERRWDQHDETLHGEGGHDEQLATLTYELGSLKDFLRVDIPKPAVDDSPVAEALQVYGGLAATDKPDEMPTDEIPIAPPTVPDGMPLAVQTALIEARDLSDERPHPVDSAERKAKNAADIEEALKRFDFSGRNR